jgi:hypothetical protein
MPADRIAVTAPQHGKHQRRYNRHPAQDDKGMMDAGEHFGVFVGA